jgi:hypothetical protein
MPYFLILSIFILIVVIFYLIKNNYRGYLEPDHNFQYEDCPCCEQKFWSHWYKTSEKDIGFKKDYLVYDHCKCGYQKRTLVNNKK